MSCSTASPPPAVVVLANVRRTTARADDHLPATSRVGVDVRRGNEHFSAGAKLVVRLHDSSWPDQVVVLGQHRGGGRLVEAHVRTRDLTNARARVVHQPRLLRAIPCWTPVGKAHEYTYGWTFETLAGAEVWVLRLALMAETMAAQFSARHNAH